MAGPSAILRLAIGMPSVGLLFGSTGAAWAQSYPNKPIRIVTAEAGSDTDTLTRLVADGLAVRLGQPVVVENRPASVRADIAGKGLPDGYTLLHTGGNFYVATLLQKTSYDPVRDFLPVSMTVRDFNILVVHPSVPATSVKELIALAKAKPGGLNYASGSVGGGNHLSAELFKSMAGVNIVRVPYKGGSGALNAALGGEVQMTFANPIAAEPHIKSGKVRALGVTSVQPSTLAAGVPPIGSSLPGYESTGGTGMFAPAKTPAAIINRLNKEMVQIVNQPEVKQKFLNSGVEPVGNSPEEFAATIKSELAKWGKVIKEAGIRLE